jgi:hypothetical protein
VSDIYGPSDSPEPTSAERSSADDDVIAGSERVVDSPEPTSAERSSADGDVITSVEIISRFETHLVVPFRLLALFSRKTDEIRRGP